MPKCFKPRWIKLSKPVVSTGEVICYVNVPCGKCSNCIKRRRMEWCFRMEQEMLNSKVSYFVTLTYDNKNVPFDKYGNLILKKDDIQKFFKRLRSAQFRYKGENRESWLYGLDLKKDKVKFFVCGEYGGRFGRPHFHAIIFNASARLIDECWGMGNVDISKASKGSIGYCTKYMDKWRDKKQDWKIPIEFNNQSEGLGLCFVEKMRGWYKNNLDVNYVLNESNVKIPMPRYFRYKLFNENELSFQTGIIYRAVLKEKEDFILKHGVDKYVNREKMIERVRNKKFDRQLKKREM